MANQTRALIAKAKVASEHTNNNGKALKVSASVTNNKWITDFDAIEHMICDSRQIQTLKPSTHTIVSVANGNDVPIIWEGDVSLSNTLNLDSDIRTRKTIGYGIRKGKLYYLELTSNNSRNLTQALAVERSHEEKDKASKEALADPHWQAAMNEKLKSLKMNATWEITDLPADKKPIGCKWVYTMKYKANEIVDHFKARLVAKGYTQKYGIDYTDTFAHVAKIKTIRVLLSLATNLDWPLQ
nr:uncharacterized protein LOC114826258 [Malus domestica]